MFHKRLIPLAVVGIVLASVASSGLVDAQNTGGSGLSISPTRTELSLSPGEADVVQVSVRNVTSGDIIAKPFINDFESDNALGEPRLYKDTEQRNSASIVNFISGLKDITLAPNESKDVEYPIAIPTKAAPGAYYGALVFRAVPAGSSGAGPGEVALTANVSSLVLIEVPGNISEKIQVLSVKARRVSSQKAKKNEGDSTFFMAQPNRVAITIKNLGNSFSKPFGTVTVTNGLGKLVQSFEVNNLNPKGNILPDSQRTFLEDLKGVSMPGRYTIDANISHGRGGEILNYKSSFWYLPFWFVAIVVALIILLVFVVMLLYRKMAKRSTKSTRR